MGVMVIVVPCRDHPLEDRMMIKPLEIGVIAQVVDHTENRHPHKEGHEDHRRYRNQPKQNREDQRFQHCLKRMKRKRSPRARGDGIVMHPVHELEYAGMMNQPVHPVKIGIMQEREDKKSENSTGNIRDRHIEPESGIEAHPVAERPDAGKPEDEGGKHGPKNLTLHDSRTGHFGGLNPALLEFLLAMNPKHPVRGPCHKKIPDHDRER